MSSRHSSSSRRAADRTSFSNYYMPQTSSSSRGAGAYYSRKASSSSAYKRSPRAGYIAAIWHKIKRMLRDLYRYMRAHPFKILLPIVMALISGGALTAVAAKVGLGELARNVEGMLGAGQSVKGGYDAWYGSQNIGGRGAAAGGWMDGMGGGSGMLKGAVKMASAFL